MMPVRQKRKKPLRKSQTFWRIGTHCPQPHGGGTTPTKPERDYRRNLAGPCERKGNHGLKSPWRLGQRMVCLRVGEALSDPTGGALPALPPIPHFAGRGAVMGGEGERALTGHPPAS
jgi:hypothetical protein